MGTNKPTIKILDAVHCHANASARKLIKPFLKYNNTYFKRNKFGGKKIDQVSYMITGRDGSSGHFYTGLLPLIKKNLRKNNIKIEIIGKIEKFKPTTDFPVFKNITLRKEQIRAFKKFKIKQRGRIILPTAYGKSTIGVGIIKMFSNLRWLYLTHTKDILTNNSNTLNKYKIKHYIQDGDNKLNWDMLHEMDSVIVLSTIQSMAKTPKEYWNLFFDGIMIDEDHHVANEKSQYGELLINSLAPMRLGMTATDHAKSRQKMICEGLIGPTLIEITNKEAIKDKIIAKPNIKLIPIPLNNKINSKCTTYRQSRLYGIVKNKVRNKHIIDESIIFIDKNKIVLIIVEDIKHGKKLQKLFLKKNIKVPFVQGKMNKIERNKIRDGLRNKKINISIGTKSWREGVDIPSINLLIYAAGMFDEKIIKQALGRGQRITDDKDEFIFIDFLDPYKHLSTHIVYRIGTYVKEGWL